MEEEERNEDGKKVTLEGILGDFLEGLFEDEFSKEEIEAERKKLLSRFKPQKDLLNNVANNGKMRLKENKDSSLPDINSLFVKKIYPFDGRTYNEFINSENIKTDENEIRASQIETKLEEIEDKIKEIEYFKSGWKRAGFNEKSEQISELNKLIWDLQNERDNLKNNLSKIPKSNVI